MRVLIAGAGIGGLTAALSLHAAGIEATVIEGARELGPWVSASICCRTPCGS